MDTRAKIGLGVGGAVIAIAAAVGVGAVAANLVGGETAATPADGQVGPGGTGGGPGVRGGTDTAALAKTLATRLGVDETKMAAALKEVMADSRPGSAPSGPPSGAPSGPPSGDARGRDRSGMVETMAKALATKLNLDEATVLAALQEAMAPQR